MLLTLTANSLRSMLKPGRTGRVKLPLLDLPDFARQSLGLHGLNLSTDLLAGLDRSAYEEIRERADKAACACLLLIEPEPQAFGDRSDAKGEAAIERTRRVIQAGHLLGCNAVAVSCLGPDTQEAFDLTVERLQEVVGRAEKLELNILISPREGLTSTPERITELIKKVGGFRVGTFPDLQTAAQAPDPVAYLRRLTPYAPVISASTVEFVPEAPVLPTERKGTKSSAASGEAAAAGGTLTIDEVELAQKPIAAGSGSTDGAAAGQEAPGAANTPMRHRPYDLVPLIRAIASVGFDGTLALDYRGGGDARLGLIRSRRAIEAALAAEHGES
jgi:hypothetical protein